MTSVNRVQTMLSCGMKNLLPLSRLCRALQVGFFLALLSLALPAFAGGGRVSTNAELQAALASTQGGVITLADGQYELLELSRAFPAPVVLRGESRAGVVLAGVRLNAVSNLTLQHLSVQGGLSIQRNSSNVTIDGLAIKGTIYCRNVERLTIHDTDIHADNFGLILNSVRDFRVTQNRIRFATEDLMRITTRSSHGLVAYNIISDTQAKRPKHPDILQLFGNDGQTPHDIVIRRNLLTDPQEKGDVMAQGIFVSDPRSSAGYRNILIEENLISVSSPNSIYVWGGEKDFTIRNNTLIPSRGDGGAVIRLAKRNDMVNAGTRVEGNVAKLLLDETKGSLIGQNYFYGRKAPMAHLFQGKGKSDRWQDFLPRFNTRLEQSGHGATAFLNDLQAGKVRLGPSWLAD